MFRLKIERGPIADLTSRSKAELGGRLLNVRRASGQSEPDGPLRRICLPTPTHGLHAPPQGAADATREAAGPRGVRHHGAGREARGRLGVRRACARAPAPVGRLRCAFGRSGGRPGAAAEFVSDHRAASQKDRPVQPASAKLDPTELRPNIGAPGDVPFSQAIEAAEPILGVQARSARRTDKAGTSNADPVAYIGTEQTKQRPNPRYERQISGQCPAE